MEIAWKPGGTVPILKEQTDLSEKEREFFDSVTPSMPEDVAVLALQYLSDFMSRYYGRKVLILLDEYDTPLQEAYVQGFWEELVEFTRSMFNSTFKTNPHMERAIMTGTVRPVLSGVTRVSRESIFSDLNNLKVVTTTSNEYEDSFGFTEEEVFAAMDECGLTDKETVKKWYDGFTFGEKRNIYNPWSILNYLDTGKFSTYWANTSSNSLVGTLIRQSVPEIKSTMEDLLNGKAFRTQIDEQIVFSLGLLVEMRGRYSVTSNRESGFGRYDVVLEPNNTADPAYILEFKVHDPEDEDTLKDTVAAALRQIEEKKYETALLARGIPAERIKKYGFAFEGKKVLIG